MARYIIGEFLFEPEESRLVKDGAIVPAQPRVLEALEFFAERPNKLLTRDDLLDALWPDTFVNEEALTQLIRKLRRALDDNPKEPKYLATVPRRGYRFVADVKAAAPEPPRGPRVEVPAWLDTGSEPSVAPPGGHNPVSDLEHLRSLVLGGASLVIGERFLLGRRVGASSRGSVYQARDLRTGELVAVKVLYRPEPTDIVRFQREVRFLRELDHDAIVPYVTHGTTENGLCFLATAWIHGEPMNLWLADRDPLDHDTFVTLARRVTQGVGHAHADGIIHRDLKPQNLMVPDDDPSRCVVLDFGLARLQWDDPVTEAGAVLGTIGYISPEQVRGHRDIDTRTDVFALGCLFFEALTGRPPFTGSPMEIMRSLAMLDAPRAKSIRPDVDERLDLLIAAMLSRDAELRPLDANAVHASLPGD